jgi:hypothetical protein
MAPLDKHGASSKPTTPSSKQDENKRVVVLLSAILVAFLCHVCANIIPSPFNYFQRIESSPILVFDNVLSPALCQSLHKEALYVKDECVGRMVVVFHWPLHDGQKPTNGVEQAIDSILQEMYSSGEKFVVEYWVKQDWEHHHAHPDVDGPLLYGSDVLQNPYKGHVLYLQKGSQVNGPTAVFPNATTGGDIMYDSTATNQQEVLVVPFLEGRLLQFQGNVLHAVPRPVDVWLHPNDDPVVYEPFETYGRSVILFNLWHKVPSEAAFSHEIFDDEKQEEHNTDGANRRISSFLCNPKSAWKSASVVNDWKESLVEYIFSKRSVFTLPLMGIKSWRGTQNRTVTMHATPHVERALLSSDVRPKRFYLEVPPFDMNHTTVDEEEELEWDDDDGDVEDESEEITFSDGKSTETDKPTEKLARAMQERDQLHNTAET